MQEFKIRKVTEKVADRFEKFCLVRKGIMTLKQASKELDLSYRHTLRLHQRFKLGGIMALAFQREHPPWNKLPQEKRDKLIKLTEELIHWTTKETQDERFYRDSVFKPLPDVNLDDVFCLREERVVNRDNTFK